MSKTNKLRSLNMLEISLLSIILLLIFGGVFLGYRYTNSLRNDITKIQGIVEKLDSGKIVSTVENVEKTIDQLNSSQIVSTVQQVQSIIDNFCTKGITIGRGKIWQTKEWPHFHFPDNDLTLGGKNKSNIGAKICGN